MLTIQNLSKSYGPLQVLKNVSFQLRPGEVLGLLGPNGVGKTTLIDAICGLNRVQDGEILFQGISLTTQPQAVKQKIGLCFQDALFDRFFTIYETLINTAMFRGLSLRQAQKMSHRWLNRLSLWEKRDSFGSQLSGGMKKRFQLAVALVHSPTLLILDEPTAGVDLGLREQLHSLIQEFMSSSDAMIILTSHDIREVADLANHLVFLKDGVVAQELYPAKNTPHFEEAALEQIWRELYLNGQENRS